MLGGAAAGAVVGFGVALVAIELFVEDEPAVLVWPALLWAALLGAIGGGAVVLRATTMNRR